MVRARRRRFEGDANHFAELAAIYEVTEAPNGKLLANSTDGRLWAFSADGKQRSLFTELSNVGVPAVCGNFVVLNSYMTGRSEMMRFDVGGSNRQADYGRYSPSRVLT